MRDPSARVIHQEAADEIVTISDSRRLHRVRGQQQSWILDPARCEHGASLLAPWIRRRRSS